MTDSLPTTVHDLPPSARFVYRELDRADSPLTVTDLQHRTGYSTRGIRHATETLTDRDLIRDGFEDDDPRRKYFDTV
jgi:DNA-binding transcriptional regulator GbsR (MarR family)